MKRGHGLVLIALLFVVGATASRLVFGQDFLKPAVMRDVFNGVDTFCVRLYSPRDVLPGDPIAADSPRREALITARVIDTKSRLTDYGWEQVDFDDGGCLTGGRFSLTVQEVSSPKWIVLPSGKRRQVTFATLKAQTEVPKLAAWAQTPAVYGSFREITAMLEGVQFRVGFVREGMHWIAALEKPLPFHVPEQGYVDAKLEKEGAQTPLPDRAVLRDRWLSEYGNWGGGKACIDVAGTSDYPVDEQILDERSVGRFSFAIYEMLERDAVQQRVLTITLPRVEALERAGVLKSSPTRGPKYRAQWPGRMYVLAAEQTPFLLQPFPYPPCLYAGQHETAVTAMKRRGVEAKMIIRDGYVSVAPWARAPEVLEQLPDLRKALEHNSLCMNSLMLNEKKWGWGPTGTCRR